MTSETHLGSGKAMAVSVLVIGWALIFAVMVVAALDQTPVGAIGEALFAFVCHGIDERSFAIGDTHLVVCARCIGVYSGLLIAGLLILSEKVRNLPWLGWFLMLPLIVDGTAQALGLWTSGNIWRFATGLLFSVGGPLTLLRLQRDGGVVEHAEPHTLV